MAEGIFFESDDSKYTTVSYARKQFAVYGLPTGADRVRSSFSTIVGSGHSLLPKMPALLCRHRLSSSILQLCSIHAFKAPAPYPLSMMAGLLLPVAVRHYTVGANLRFRHWLYLASIVDRSLRQGFMGQVAAIKPDKRQ